VAARPGTPPRAHRWASHARRHVSRPAVLPPPGPGVGGLPHAGRGPVPVRGRHASRWRRERRERNDRIEGRAAGPEGPSAVIGLDDLTVFAEGLNHSEGVVWNPADGCVYAGGELGEFYRVSLDGTVERLATTNGWMLGLAVDAAGRVYACDHGH